MSFVPPNGFSCDETSRTVSVPPGGRILVEFACLPSVGLILVTVRIDGEPVVNQVTVVDVGSQTTTPAPAVFEVTPGTYTVTAVNPPASKCSFLSQEVTVAIGQTVEVVFDCVGLAGGWVITYEVIEQNCFVNPPAPFDVTANLVTSENQVSVIFPDAPDSIDGTYDPVTMIFSGTTDLVELPDPPGTFAQEAYSVTFMLVDGLLTFEGESLVTFTFMHGGECTVRYRVTGRRVS